MNSVSPSFSFNMDKAEKYVPYSKSSNNGNYVRINVSGHISIGWKIYDEVITPSTRVNLYFLNEPSGNLIGIEPAKDGEGLKVKVIENKRGKSRYVSARGFLKKHHLDFMKRVSVEVFQDTRRKIIVVPLPVIDVNKDIGNEEMSSGFNSATRLSRITGHPTQETDAAILKVLPAASSRQAPMCVLDLYAPVAKELKLRGKVRTQFKRHIKSRLRELEREGKISMAYKRPYKGKGMKYYWKT